MQMFRRVRISRIVSRESCVSCVWFELFSVDMLGMCSGVSGRWFVFCVFFQLRKCGFAFDFVEGCDDGRKTFCDRPLACGHLFGEQTFPFSDALCGFFQFFGHVDHVCGKFRERGACLFVDVIEDLLDRSDQVLGCGFSVLNIGFKTVLFGIFVQAQSWCLSIDGSCFRVEQDDFVIGDGDLHRTRCFAFDHEELFSSSVVEQRVLTECFDRVVFAFGDLDEGCACPAVGCHGFGLVLCVHCCGKCGLFLPFSKSVLCLFGLFPVWIF